MTEDFQRDAESRFGGTRFNLKPVTQDPIYPKDGDSWFRVDQGLIKLQLGGTVYGMALVDSTTGKLTESQVPELSITEVFVVNSEAEMLALVAQPGDVAIREDLGSSYILVSEPATLLANWHILASVTAAVVSVNGEVGIVNLSTTDIPEGINLYYSATRFNSAFSAKTTSDLTEGSNLYYTDSRFDTRLASKTTSNLTEGSNLYYTDARFDTRLASKTTDNLSEGTTNLYYTSTRANSDFDTRLATKTTTNLAEGTNLYFTNARFDTRLGTKTTTDLVEGSNLYYTDTRFDTRLDTKSTSNLTEGSNLYFTNTRADARITAQKGVANGLATLDGSGTIPVSQLPGEGTTETFSVASQVAMLALSAQKGDIAKRTDTKDVYILTANPASTLGNWEKIVENYDANVETVNGASGAVVLTTSDIGEGTNLYYTASRFNTAFAAKSTSDLSEGSNLYYTDARFDTRLATKTTSNLTEGSNLYYTTSRANTDFDTRLATKTTSNLAEGTNLYYTTARANTDFDARLLTKTTDNLAEGSSNLYYTNARFDTRLGTKTTSDLAEGTNLYFTNSRADARIALQKGAVNGIATLDGSGKIPTSQLPALAITDTFVVGSQVAMLALSAETGDVAVRTDLNKTYILKGTDPTLLADWQELLTPTDSVLSVNGQTGAVTLTTTNISEGTNLYYTDTRFDTRFATKTTTNLTEGSNLYYTDERVDDRVAVLIQNGTGISWSYNDAGGSLTPTVSLSSFSTTNLAEGTNLYYTQSRFDTAFAAKSTTGLTEGTNLYYTQARFDTAFSGKSTTNLSEGTNLYYTDTRVRANRLDQMAAPNTDLSMATHKVTNVVDPTAAQDAATKNYVDTTFVALISTLHVRKTADESVTSSTTLQDDDHLFLTLAANTNYVIDGYISVTSATATPDVKIAFVIPSGTLNISYIGIQTGPSTNPRGCAILTSSGVDAGEITIAAGATDVIHIKGTVSIGVTGGTFKLQWAQNTSNATATTVKAGGYISATKV